MLVPAVVPRFRGDAKIEWTHHENPEPGASELRLRLAANAICGTDRHEYYDGSPIVPGHEAAGIVADAGPGTTTAPGTRGVVYLMDFCGECRSCRITHRLPVSELSNAFELFFSGQIDKVVITQETA